VFYTTLATLIFIKSTVLQLAACLLADKRSLRFFSCMTNIGTAFSFCVSRGLELAGACWKKRMLGGHTSAGCGLVVVSGMDAACYKKNSKHDVCYFFYLTDSDHGELAAPPPL
jgi:hypothetical protein